METPPVNLMQFRDNALLEAARKIGLNLQHDEGRWLTGFEWLVIEPSSVGTFESESGQYQGTALGMTVWVKDPLENRRKIVQIVTDLGSPFYHSVEDSITNHIDKWANGVLPPLCCLFGTEHGEIVGKLKLESYTEGDEAMTLWEGFAGQPQFWGDSGIQERIEGATLYKLLHPFICDFLNVKEMLWFDIEGEVMAGGGGKIEIEIDGHEHEGLSAELSANFNWSGLDQPCKFRQFIIVRPYGTKPLAEAKPEMQQTMREHNVDTTPRKLAPSAPTEPKPKFKFPFLRKQK